jgi:aryl-alcohol dehydrogenase-like predicted oxidoreductase
LTIHSQKNTFEGSAIATRPGALSMREAVRYILSHPVSTVIVGCDNIAQLEENVQIAREFTPLSQAQMTALSNLVAPVAKQSLFFHFQDRTSIWPEADSG